LRTTAGYEEAMTDLSHPPLNRMPQAEDGFAWPTPDLADYPASTASALPPACQV
jgi:hypothetical protein